MVRLGRIARDHSPGSDRAAVLTTEATPLSIFLYTCALGACFAAGLLSSIQAVAATDTQFQAISGHAFFKTECMQAAVRPNAAWGHTVSNSTLTRAGFNPQASGMGFIAKRDCSEGWVTTGNINGDYFMPGSPYEGWGLRVGGTWVNYTDSRNTSAGTLGAPSLNVSTNEYEVSWSHTQAGVQIDKTYRLPLTGESIFMDVTLTNTTDGSLSNIVYGRGVDPDDNNHSTNLPGGASVNPVSGSQFVSFNTVVAQHASDNYGLVTAKFNDVSLLGLFSADPRARVARENSGFNTGFDPLAVWNGTGGFLTFLDEALPEAGNLADAGMNLAINVGTLDAGQSTAFTLAYLLSAEAVEENVSAVSAAVTETSTGGEFSATSDAAGIGYWIVVPRGATTPTATQIKDGVDYAAVVVAASGFDNIDAGETTLFTIDGLNPGVDYDVYFVIEFGEGGFSEITKFEFTTLSPEALRLTGSTAELTAGSSRVFVLDVLDQSGDVVVVDNGRTVTLAQSGGTGSVIGLSDLTIEDGTATLTLTGNRAGSITLTASATGLAADSLSFEVVTGPPNQLLLSVGPQRGESGLPLAVQPVVEVQDASGNRTNSSAPITAVLLSPDGDAATLNGNTTINAVNGLAVFTDLELSNAGLGPYQLRFESPDLTPVTSAPLQALPYTLLVFDGSGSGLYPEGEVVEIAADPAPDGQRFAGWLGDVADMDNANLPSTSVTMPASDVGAVASYVDLSEVTYTVIINDGQGDGDYRAGEWVDISTITPEGQRFTGWTGDGVDYLVNPLQAATQLYMPAAAVTLTANFETPSADLHTLTVVNGQGSGQFKAGDVVAIAAAEPPSGQRFDRWVGDVAGLDRVTLPSATLTMPQGDVVLSARFKPIGLQTHELTVLSGSGGGAYLPGTWVDIEAAPVADGQRFERWESDVAFVEAPQQASTRVFMPARDAVVAARLQAVPVDPNTLTVTGGTGGGSYTSGTSVTITANAAPSGQVFDRWVGDVASVANPNLPTTTFIMPNRDAELAARYRAAAPGTTFSLTVTNGSGDGDFVAGTSVDIEASVLEGFSFAEWSGQVQGVADRFAANTTVLMPAADVTLRANFRINRHALSVSSGSGSGVYDFAEQVSIAADPAPAGQQFAGWQGDVTTLNRSDQPNAVVTMPDGPVSLTASYVAQPTVSRRLTVSNGMGTGDYTPGTLVEVAALPAPSGQVFSNWTGDTAALTRSDSPNTQLLMPSSAVSISANYVAQAAPGPLDLTVVNGRGSGPSPRGRWVEISANPAPSGGVFDRWEADADVLLFNRSQANTRVFMRDQAVTVTARYRSQPATQYALNVTNGNGGGSYRQGDEVELVAAPAAEGQRFVRWQGDVEFIDNPNLPNAIFTMPSRAAQVTAIYGPRPEGNVNITVINGQGGGEFRPGTWIAITGQTVEVASTSSLVRGSRRKATVDPVFVGWEGDIGFVENPNLLTTYVLVPDRDSTVAAAQLLLGGVLTRNLTVTDGTGGGARTVGEEVTITANAAPAGQRFDRWLGDTAFLANARLPITTLTMPDRDLSVSASYVDLPTDTDTVTLTVEGGLGSGDYQPGSLQMITAAVPSGFNFVQWQGPRSVMVNRFDAQTTVVVPDEDLTLTAELEPIDFAESLRSDIINSLGGTGLDAETLAAIDEAINTLLTIAQGGDAELTVAQLNVLGFTNITAADLPAITDAVASTPASGSGLATLAQLQALIQLALAGPGPVAIPALGLWGVVVLILLMLALAGTGRARRLGQAP